MPAATGNRRSFLEVSAGLVGTALASGCGDVHFDEAYRPWNLYGFPDDKIGLVTLVDRTFDKVTSHHPPTQNVADLRLVDVVIEGKTIRSPA
jgi:hypothetical protein